jgi:predicted DCC family thiol-disulfide oxidoreductase YuxK
MPMIVVFDAKCLLCNGWVRFLLKHDRKGQLQFASIQGAAGRRLLAEAGLPVEDLRTLLLTDGDRSWQHTAAVLRVLHYLGWPWRAAWIGWLVPAPLRDAAYRLIARNRYRLFGRTEVCLLPKPEFRHRFLDGPSARPRPEYGAFVLPALLCTSVRYTGVGHLNTPKENYNES